MIPPDRTRPWHQTNWDWRAALNFILGGTGAGLLVSCSLFPLQFYSKLAAIGGLGIIVGLISVWFEIGRPLRALNVFIHTRTSWMTRESWAALAALASAAFAAVLDSAMPRYVVVLTATSLLYCQGRIFMAAKGIPAWRLPIVVPLIIVTGLLEGVGVLVLGGIFSMVGLASKRGNTAEIWPSF